MKYSIGPSESGSPEGRVRTCPETNFLINILCYKLINILKIDIFLLNIHILKSEKNSTHNKMINLIWFPMILNSIIKDARKIYLA